MYVIWLLYVCVLMSVLIGLRSDVIDAGDIRDDTHHPACACSPDEKMVENDENCEHSCTHRYIAAAYIEPFIYNELSLTISHDVVMLSLTPGSAK